MASLAPGNGWFPNRNPERSHESRRSSLPGRSAASDSNVYAFPPTRAGLPARPEIEDGLVNGAFSSLMARQDRAGRSTSWIIGWCVFGLALASMAWIAMIGALFAAAIIFGVPWLTAAVAFGAAHVLAAALAALIGVRVSRTLLPSHRTPTLTQ